MLTDLQLLIVTSVIGLFVSFLTARQTASSESVKSLSMALSSLRGEFENVKREYEQEQKENAEIKEAYDKIRRENRFFKNYIERLITLLSFHQIEVPPMEEYLNLDGPPPGDKKQKEI